MSKTIEDLISKGYAIARAKGYTGEYAEEYAEGFAEGYIEETKRTLENLYKDKKLSIHTLNLFKDIATTELFDEYKEKLKDMKIFNIHGYKGSAENSACLVLKELGYNVTSPQTDYDAENPDRILADLRKTVDEIKPDYIVGTSFGGFFATLIAKYTDIPTILINPCLKPCTTLSELGYTIDENRKTTLTEFEAITEKMDFQNITAIIGGQDEVISYHDTVTKRLITNCIVIPDGRHSGATLPLRDYFSKMIKQ